MFGRCTADRLVRREEGAAVESNAGLRTAGNDGVVRYMCVLRVCMWMERVYAFVTAQLAILAARFLYIAQILPACFQCTSTLHALTALPQHYTDSTVR